MSFRSFIRLIAFASLILLSGQGLFSQTEGFKTITHAEFFSMLENSTDTVFRLDNTIVRFDASTDSQWRFTSEPGGQNRNFTNTDTLVIDKTLMLSNVHFDHSDRRLSRAFHHIRFNKDVFMINTASVIFIGCDFKERLVIVSTESMATAVNLIDRGSRMVSVSTSILDSKLRKGVSIDMGSTEEKTRSQVRLENSEIWSSTQGRGSRLNAIALASLSVRNNHFIGEGRVTVISEQIDEVNISDNDFGQKISEIRVLGTEDLNTSILEDNIFGNHVLLDLDQLTTSSTYQWAQWSDWFLSFQGFNEYFATLPDSLRGNGPFDLRSNEKAIERYKTEGLVQDAKSYKQEVKLRGKLLDLYKAQHDLEDVNTVYIELKDLETDRLAYLYSLTPSFTTFFKWKVNQFLKSFSDYGTEPSKAIVFSVNVVFLFAFIYLFFPNSWDEQGKHRILNRFNFYQKYLRSSAGAHEIYLENRNLELTDYETFKKNIEEGELELPKFFVKWSKPVYYFAMFGTKLSSIFLKKTDFLSGKWNELSPSQKRWKNVQIGVFLIIGVLWDVAIRVLNALMLSINAFTTLGFGEIPIKGLPRYLAIIQGFIGWFMLTIFSVSLISQLLN